MLSIEMNFSNWLGSVEASGIREDFDPLLLVSSDCKTSVSTLNDLIWVSSVVKPWSHIMERTASSMSIISLHMVNICSSACRHERLIAGRGGYAIGCVVNVRGHKVS